MKSRAQAERSSFETFLQSRPEIMGRDSMYGKSDYPRRIVLEGVADYEQFLTRQGLNYPDVAASASDFALSHAKYTTEISVYHTYF